MSTSGFATKTACAVVVRVCVDSVTLDDTCSSCVPIQRPLVQQATGVHRPRGGDGSTTTRTQEASNGTSEAVAVAVGSFLHCSFPGLLSVCQCVLHWFECPADCIPLSCVHVAPLETTKHGLARSIDRQLRCRQRLGSCPMASCPSRDRTRRQSRDVGGRSRRHQITDDRLYEVAASDVLNKIPWSHVSRLHATLDLNFVSWNLKDGASASHDHEDDDADLDAREVCVNSRSRSPFEFAIVIGDHEVESLRTIV